MLNQINLRYFKCFDLLRLPLAPLTLLSGTNASGKSSILQTLVLLHQTMREHEWATRLMLNGTAIRLGTVRDVVDKVHGRNTIEIGLTDSGTEFHWSVEGEHEATSMQVDGVAVAGTTIDNPETLRHLLPPNADKTVVPLAERMCRLGYITAERVGPREIYSLEDEYNTPFVGPKGEYAMSVLHRGRDERVPDDLAIPNVPSTRWQQVQERMRHFFPGYGMELTQIPNANAVTLAMRISEDTGFHRPVHIGFGLTQTLPIIVAALSARREDMLLIENPEVHLHPAGQALMGQFLADVAHAGVQVLVESHSDHILNGIRRAVKGERLSPEHVAIHFFKPRRDGETQVITPTMNASGSLDDWPDGFFDQFDKDMNYFAGWDA